MNDANNHKNKLEWQHSQYSVVANITEYHIISKLIFLRIIIPKFLKIKQFLPVKNECKNVKNQHVKMDVWTVWLQSLSSIPNCYIPESLNSIGKF